MHSAFTQSVVSLFDKAQDRSSIPAKIHKADVRSGGTEPTADLIRGRPRDRCECALPATDTRTEACRRSFARRACFFAIMLSLSMSCVGTVLAKNALAVHAAKSSFAEPIAGFIAEASQRFGISAHWIRAVMHVESAGRPRALSPRGAMGLMQIMPETWAELRARYGFGSDPYDPRDNILAGAAYLREMHDRYGPSGFLAAYNAGPGRFENHLITGRTLPVETREYVAKLAPMMESVQPGRKTMIAKSAPTWRQSSIFVVRGGSNSTGDRPSSDMHSNRTSTNRPVVDLSALAPQSVGLFVHQAREARSQ